MFSMVKKMNQHKKGDRKGKGILVDDGYNSFGRLEHLHDDHSLLLGGVDNGMLASQEIQGPSTPAQSHGCSVVVEKEKEKEKHGQPPKDKPSILLFSTHLKPRLRWTPKLHALFTDAINELGGAAKATPKAVQTAMDLDGLTLFHVKSHLQKFRMGKAMVKELKEVPKICTNIGTSKSNRPVCAKGHAKAKDSKVRKTSKARKGEIYLKLQEARQKYVDNAVKKLFNQYIAEANASVASMSKQNLAGLGTMPTTPSLYPSQENTYSPYNTLERIKECLGLQKQPSSSGSYKPQNQYVAHSAPGSYTTSDGFSFPTYNSTNANNMPIGLKEQPESYLPQNVTYSATRDLRTSLGYSYPAYNPINAVDVHVSLKEQPQSFLPQNAAFSFEPENAAYNYQPQNAAHGNQSQNAAHGNQSQKAAYNYQPQNAAYGYQSQDAAYFATNDFLTSNGNYSGSASHSATSNFQTSNGNCSGSAAYSATNGLPASNGNFSGSAAYSATNNFPTSNGNFSGTTAYSAYATDNFLTSNRNCSGSATYSAANNFPTSNVNYSRNAAYSATNDFPTSNGNYSGSATYSAANFPTSKGNYSGSATYSVANNLTILKGNYSGGETYSVANNFTTKANYSGGAASPYSAIKDLTSNEIYSGSTAYTAANNFPMSNGKYSGTEHLENLTAALAAFGNKSLLGALVEDPVDAYMNWDNPEPNTQDVGLSFNNPYGNN